MEETNSLVELEQLRNEEYEKQFFGESIDKMKTKFAQCLKKVILDSFSQLTKTLLRTYPDKSEEISKICEEISDSYISSSNSYVDKFHKLLLESASIPDSLLLPEDEDQLVQYTEEEEKEIDNKIKELSKEYQKLCIFEELFEKEIDFAKVFQEVEEELKRINNSDSFNKEIIENVSILLEGIVEF